MRQSLPGSCHFRDTNGNAAGVEIPATTVVNPHKKAKGVRRWLKLPAPPSYCFYLPVPRGEMPDDMADSLTGIALDTLAVLPSLL
jgi:hypothetical protein